MNEAFRFLGPFGWTEAFAHQSRSKLMSNETMRDIVSTFDVRFNNFILSARRSVIFSGERVESGSANK
jgi:hypothetical protein